MARKNKKIFSPHDLPEKKKFNEQASLSFFFWWWTNFFREKIRRREIWWYILKFLGLDSAGW